MMTKLTTPGRMWAYLFLAAGLGVSLWANVAAVHIAPESFPGVPDDYQPPGVRILMAALAPAAMFGVIEVVARNLWPGDWRWQIVKWTFAVSVGVWAGTISYKHLFHLANHNMGVTDGSLTIEAVGTPLMIDGLILLCTAALLIPKAQPEVEGPTHVLSTATSRSLARSAALSDAMDTSVAVAFGLPPREIVRVEQVIVEKPVEVEKIVYVDREPTARRRTKTPPRGDRKRYPTGQHPKYPDWEAARMTKKPWTVEDMQAALGADTTEIAAKSALQRWEAHYVAREGERRTARRNGSEPVVDADDPAPAVAEGSAPVAG